MRNKHKMLGRIAMGLVVTVLLALAACAAWYVWSSRQNPKVVEIVGGSILITLLLGSSSTLFTKVFEKPNRHKASVTVWFLISGSLLLILIAFLVYSANVPRDIKREIPVTYLIDMNELELPSDLETVSSEAHFLYEDAVCLFRNLKGGSPDKEEQIRKLFDYSSASGLAYGPSLFLDLTEILIPRCIAGPAEGGEMEPAYWRGEAFQWQALPHRSIAGANVDFNDMREYLLQNQFFGIPGSPLSKIHKMVLRLPKGTRVRLLPKDSKWSSVYVISNDFLEVRIRVQVFVSGLWLRLTFPAESAFRPSLTSGNKRRGPFSRVETMIYYDATFSKYRYSLPQMHYYEEWANDLFTLLERRFAWGSPPLLDSSEVIKRYRSHMNQGQQ